MLCQFQKSRPSSNRSSVAFVSPNQDLHEAAVREVKEAALSFFTLPTAQEFKLVGQCLMTVYIRQILVGRSLMPALFSKEHFADAALKLCIMDLPEITISALRFTGNKCPHHGFWLDYFIGCELPDQSFFVLIFGTSF